MLDIGCGQGLIFAGLVRYPNLHAFGLSSFDYRSDLTRWNGLDTQVDYRVGDAQRLATVFPDIRFDVIVSQYTFEYLADPLLALKQAYRLCNEGGIILLDKFQILTSQQAGLLKTYWEKHGIKPELKRWAPDGEKYDPSRYSLALQRGGNLRLPLPFKYAEPVVVNTSRIDGSDETYEVRFSYSFDEETAWTKLANPSIPHK